MAQYLEYAERLISVNQLETLVQETVELVEIHMPQKEDLEG